MTRTATREDYNNLLLSWFKEYSWTAVPYECLPSNQFITEYNNTPAVYTCYYSAECNLALLGFTIANPLLDIPSSTIEEALRFTIEHAKSTGHKYIRYSTGQKGVGLVRKLKKLGMSVICPKGYIMHMATDNSDISFLEED